MEHEPAEPPGPRPSVLGTDQECSIEVEDATGRLSGGLVAWIGDRAGAAATFLGCTGEVRVRIVDDVAMSAAHERHLGDASTTDVMTFDMADGAAARTGVLDTDILVCLDEAERQGSLRGHASQFEVLLYIVHGILHCVGHDDRTRAGARAMHAREDEVLTAIGVGVVYRAGDGGGDGGEGAGP